MAEIKFTLQQIDKFNDKMENCLEDAQCRQVFKHYLEVSDRIQMKAYKLWEVAKNTDSYDETRFSDLIDDVTGIDETYVLSLPECNRLDYIKMETCKMLDPIHSHFIKFLEERHKM